MTILYKNQSIATDKQGYLLDFTEWNEDIAVLLANGDNVELSEPHWEVIRLSLIHI